jgi:hypothetical protein
MFQGWTGVKGVMGDTTNTRILAADLLQMQRSEIIGSIMDCNGGM